MSKLIALVCLLAGAVYAQPWEGRCRDRSQQRNRLCGSGPLFEFAPASGAGMTATCACTSPTGSKGEVLTFTRASTGMCSKGNSLSAIANGDLVLCSSNQPRVMLGGAGTGAAGILVEGARTNVLLRSEALDDAVWTGLGTGVAAPVVTANAAVGPDGNTTAEKLDLTATAAGQASALQQLAVGAGGQNAASLYIKGVSGSGSVDICTNDGATTACTSCAFVSATWTRCRRQNVTVGAGTDFSFGNLTSMNGGTTRPTQSVYVWGTQLESSAAFVSSYIPTGGASATRAADNASFAVSLPVTTGGSLAASVTTRWGSGGLSSGDYVFLGMTSTQILDYRPAITGMTFYGVAGGTNVLATMTGHAETRIGAYWTGVGSVTPFIGITATAGTVTTFAASTVLELGSTGGGAHSFAVVSRVCADPNPSRCR